MSRLDVVGVSLMESFMPLRTVPSGSEALKAFFIFYIAFGLNEEFKVRKSKF